jgi:hypothetical protein
MENAAGASGQPLARRFSRMCGWGVDSGDEFAGGEGEWWAGGADVCVTGACEGEMMPLRGNEPPAADPHAGWCGRGLGVIRVPPDFCSATGQSVSVLTVASIPIHHQVES